MNTVPNYRLELEESRLVLLEKGLLEGVSKEVLVQGPGVVYQYLVDNKKDFVFDEQQFEIAGELQKLFESLNRKKKFLSFSQKPYELPHCYFHGGAGCGKTTVINIFEKCAQAVNPDSVEVVHFLTLTSDVVKPAFKADLLKRGVKVLIIDEFEELTDIADKPLVNTFVKEMRAAGITVIATSNVKPEPPFSAKDGIEFPTRDLRVSRPLSPRFADGFDSEGGALLSLPNCPRQVQKMIEKGAINMKKGTARFAEITMASLEKSYFGPGDYRFLAENLDILFIPDLKLPIAATNKEDFRRLTVLVDFFEKENKRVIVSEPINIRDFDKESLEDDKTWKHIFLGEEAKFLPRARRVFSRLSSMQGLGAWRASKNKVEPLDKISEISTVVKLGDWKNPRANVLAVDSFMGPDDMKRMIPQVKKWAEENQFAVALVLHDDALMADTVDGIKKAVDDLIQAEKLLIDNTNDSPDVPMIDLGFSLGGGLVHQHRIQTQKKAEMFIWSSVVINSGPAWDADALVYEEAGKGMTGDVSNREYLDTLYDSAKIHGPDQTTIMQWENRDRKSQEAFVPEYEAHDNVTLVRIKESHANFRDGEKGAVESTNQQITAELGFEMKAKVAA